MPIRLTPAVKALLILSFGTFIIQQTGDRWLGIHFTSFFGLIPQKVLAHGWIWQLVTYSFLDVDPMHLFFNLLLLAFIGSELERGWGARRFLSYYFFCVVSAGLAYLALNSLFGHSLGSAMIGASAGLYGLLAAFGILFGETVMLFMLVFPMKAKHFVLLLGLFELMTTLYSPAGGVGSISHLMGMAAGVVYLWTEVRYRVFQRDLKQRQSRHRTSKKRSQHLKLVVSNRDTNDSDSSPDNQPKIWH